MKRTLNGEKEIEREKVEVVEHLFFLNSLETVLFLTDGDMGLHNLPMGFHFLKIQHHTSDKMTNDSLHLILLGKYGCNQVF